MTDDSLSRIPEDPSVKGDDGHTETSFLLELFAAVVERGLVLEREMSLEMRAFVLEKGGCPEDHLYDCFSLRR